MSMRYFVLLLAFLIPMSFSHGQALGGLDAITGNNIRLELSKTDITPFTDIVASLNDYASISQSMDINWQVDGKNIPEATNKREMTFTTKDVGQNTTVTAFVKQSNGVTVPVSLTVTPVFIDIILEPQTRTPVFYRGRALPSLFSTVNLTALVNGTINNSSDYIYRWQLNNTVLDKGSLMGNYKTSVETPYGAYNTISVVITRRDGSTVGSKTVSLPSVSPSLVFYEVNTLYGVKPIAKTNSVLLTDSNLRLLAEPYYLEINTYNHPGFLEWKLNNSKIPSGNQNPYETILSKPASVGNTNLSFRAGNQQGQMILQRAEGSLKVQ